MAARRRHDSRRDGDATSVLAPLAGDDIFTAVSSLTGGLAARTLPLFAARQTATDLVRKISGGK